LWDTKPACLRACRDAAWCQGATTLPDQAADALPRTGGAVHRQVAIKTQHGAPNHDAPAARIGSVSHHAWGGRVTFKRGCVAKVCGSVPRWPPLRVGSRGGAWWELPPARRCSARWRVSPGAVSLCPAWVGAAGVPRAVRCAARPWKPVATHISRGRGRGALSWRPRDGSSTVGPPAHVSRCPLEPRGFQVGCEVHACECVGAAWGRNTSNSCLP
jgi:hypothetical protein